MSEQAKVTRNNLNEYLDKSHRPKRVKARPHGDHVAKSKRSDAFMLSVLAMQQESLVAKVSAD